MAQPIAQKTFLQIRQAIGYNVGERKFIASTWSISGSTTTAKDAVELSQGGDKEYIGAQVQFNEVTGDGYGLRRYVTDSDVSGVITFPTISSASLVTGAPEAGEDYELWKSPLTIQDVNNKIGNAENEVAGLIFMDKEDHTTFTQAQKYQYSFPSGFSHLSAVEYCSSIENEEQVDSCDTVWITGASNVSASVETTLYKEGSGAAKLVVAAGAVTGKLFYFDFDALDLSDKTEIELWMYSTVAVTGGELRLLLDDTTGCPSQVENLLVPATSAYAWTHHIISLAAPVNDSAIVSVGFGMADDISAATIRLDDIRAVDAKSRVWKPLNTDHWDIVHGSTPALMLTPTGLAVAGENHAVRLTGYRQFTAMSGDTSVSEVDPDFLINRVSQQLTTGDKAKQFEQRAELAKARARRTLRAGTVQI